MQQTIGILISNALRYTPPQGSITVAAKSDRARVTIEVADTGSGIAPEDLPHVFDRFYRADKSRSRGKRRIGPGVSHRQEHRRSARRIDRGAECKPGQGTQLIIRLPRVA